MCKYCGKQFDGGTKLRAHVNVHEGEYFYCCTVICADVTRQAGELLSPNEET